MHHRLPTDFIHKMQELLREEYSDFAGSFQLPRAQGLRVNSQKLSPDCLPAMVPFTLQPVPWCRDGFYYSQEDRPGKHPYHAAGLYYIQEPSAMAVVEALDPQPGDRILDISAAPGGKATQLGARLKGQGLLVANEIVPNRAKILAENLERFGAANCIVLNEHPQKLAGLFPAYFDKIVVDAPCSGEGMFRKEPEVCTEWSLQNVTKCAARQVEILTSALSMLKPGGKLVYSTCTFSPEENEQVIAKILTTHPDLQLVTPTIQEHFAPGRPEWAGGLATLSSTLRLWPHLLSGEGHFVALLQKNLTTPGLEDNAQLKRKLAVTNLPSASRDSLELWQDFCAANLDCFTTQGHFIQFAEYLYVLPTGLPDLRGVKIVRPGLLLGSAKKGRFEPNHALALSISPEQVRRKINLAVEDSQVYQYLKGETLSVPGEKGWSLVTVNGFPLGWGKHDGQTLKNHYPKGLRRVGI